MTAAPAVALGAMAAAPPAAESQEDIDRANALASRDKERLRQLGRLAEDAPAELPFRRVDGATGYASLILPKRDAPYTVPELAIRFPDSFERTSDGTYLVKDDIVVGRDAELRIASDRVRQLRLLSSPERFVTLTSWLGSIVVEGEAWRRVAVLSWDPALSGPDTTLADGRAWIHTRRGTMSIAWADLDYLGFATGSLSGVAWEGRSDDPARGNVTGSNFRHNYFGAYTFEAVEMRWRLNTFAHNVGYGFDPHDQSNYFLVEFNRAYGNGTHGIIFSRHCRFNVIRYNHSFDNGMHGIVLDDGPNLNPDGTPRERQGIPSDDNIVINNVVTGNEVGIVLDGGERNIVSSNVVANNNYGIRMKDAVSGNALSSNRVVNNATFGIYLYNGSNNNQLSGNTVVGGESGLVVRDSTGNVIDGNALSEMHRHGVSLAGDVSGTSVTNNKITDVETGISLSRVTDVNHVTREGNAITDETSGGEPDSVWQPLGRWAFWAAVLAFPVLLGPWYTRLIAGVRRRVRLPRLSGSAP
jgi:parallel beta-helix repeat protein